MFLLSETFNYDENTHRSCTKPSERNLFCGKCEEICHEGRICKPCNHVVQFLVLIRRVNWSVINLALLALNYVTGIVHMKKENLVI